MERQEKEEREKASAWRASLAGVDWTFLLSLVLFGRRGGGSSAELELNFEGAMVASSTTRPGLGIYPRKLFVEKKLQTRWCPMAKMQMS